MNRMMIMLSSLMTAMVAGAVPTVSNVRTEQLAGTRKVTITYDLTVEAGIVTVDVRTNRGDGVYVSIGDSHLRGMQGDVNRKVATKNDCKVYWHPGKYWEEGGEQADIKAYVTAWSEKAPPNYMSIGLDKYVPGQVEYYTSEDALPEPISSDRWRTTHMLLRKIPARGVTWRIGAASGEFGYSTWLERPHMVQLTHDYYLGVFEVTQGQWNRVMGTWPSKFSNPSCREVRPVEGVYPGGDLLDCAWPNADPEAARAASATKFFAQLRTQSALNYYLCLPTEAQWEYAARAGVATGYTDGSDPAVSTGEDETLGKLARYKGNAGSVTDFTTADLTIGTARVGSYEPNAWGLYDVLGNVEEMCLDYYDGFNVLYTTTEIYVDPVGPETGVEGHPNRRIDRGGSWCSEPKDTRLGGRSWYVESQWSSGAANSWTGFRVCYELAD